MPGVSVQARTNTVPIERVPGSGVSVGHYAFSPDDQLWQLWVENEAFPRIEFDLRLSQVRTGDGTVPTTPLAGGGSTTYRITEVPADTTASGLIIQKTAGEAITRGQPLYLATDGKVYRADGTAVGKQRARYLALATVALGATVDCLRSGVYRDDAVTFGTSGQDLYLSTLGLMTTTQPVATDQHIQLLGWVEAQHRIFFDPDLTWDTHV